MIFALWGLGSFVFFKVVFDACFSRDISVIAAILLGAMVAISLSQSSYYYAVKMGRHLARIATGRPSNYFVSTWKIWMIEATLNVCVGKAIVFGFAKRFNYELGSGILFSFHRFDRNDTFLFVLLIIIPVTLHYVMALFGVNGRTKAVSDRANETSNAELDEK